MKKEKIFVNKITKKLNNNQEYCNILEESDELDDGSNTLDIDTKIAKLFNTNGYVFNRDVKIITKDKVYQTKIAGKVHNHVITLDNDIIDISSIIDIVF